MREDAVQYGPTDDVTAEELIVLFAQTTWARDRAVTDVEAMLRASPVAVAARSDGALVGYARALTDGRFRALVDDVVVDAAWRGHGVGRELVRRLLGLLRDVEEVRLACGPDLVPFYEGIGFRLDTGTQMIARPERE